MKIPGEKPAQSRKTKAEPVEELAALHARVSGLEMQSADKQAAKRPDNVTHINSTHAVMEAIPALACLVKNGSIVFINTYGAQMLAGDNAAGLVGAPLESFFGTKYKELIKENSLPWLAQHSMFPLKLKRIDNEEIEAEACISELADRGEQQFLLIARDVSETKHALEALLAGEQSETGKVLEKTQEQLEDAIESINEGFEIYDAEKRLVLCNTRAKELSPQIADLMVPGVSLETLIRRSVDKGIVDDDIEDLDAWVADRLEQRRRPQGAFEVKLYDGRWLRVSEHRTKSGGVVAIRSDITPLKEAEERLKESEKLNALGQLAGGVAHDFNNVLMIIDGYAKRAINKPEAAVECLGEVVKATEKAKSLTSQLLIFGRREKLRPEVIRAADTLGDFEALMKPLLGATIDLVVDTANHDACIEVDTAQLSQALINLLINARDAMPRGGQIRISLDVVKNDQTLRRKHSSATASAYVCFSVEDEGFGMDGETLARVFEPFFTTKEAGKGTGLGLAMVYGFVQQSNGLIEADSDQSKGSTFRIHLPLVAREPVIKADGTVEDLTGNGETVLLAEDDDALRNLAKLTLEELGYKVLAACDGFEALELEGDHAGPIDLLLSDIIMPGLTGFELTHAIIASRPDIRVVLMSGYPARGEQQSQKAPRNVPLLKKPVDPEVLARTVRGALTGTASVV